MKRFAIPIAFILLVAACGTDSTDADADADADATSTTEAVATTETTEAMPTTETTEAMDDAMATGPAEIMADAQTSDGTTVVVASVTLPGPGFVVIHADGGLHLPRL